MAPLGKKAAKSTGTRMVSVARDAYERTGRASIDGLLPKAAGKIMSGSRGVGSAAAGRAAGRIGPRIERMAPDERRGLAPRLLKALRERA